MKIFNKPVLGFKAHEISSICEASGEVDITFKLEKEYAKKSLFLKGLNLKIRMRIEKETEDAFICVQINEDISVLIDRDFELKDIFEKSMVDFAKLILKDPEFIEANEYPLVYEASFKGSIIHSVKKLKYYFKAIKGLEIEDTNPLLFDFIMKNYKNIPTNELKYNKELRCWYSEDIERLIKESQGASDEELIEIIALNMII